MVEPVTTNPAILDRILSGVMGKIVKIGQDIQCLGKKGGKLALGSLKGVCGIVTAKMVYLQGDRYCEEWRGSHVERLFHKSL